MKVKYESETPWLFQLNGFLEDRNLTSDDVTEVVMMVKNNPTDADGSALVTKRQSVSEIVFVSDNAMSVDIDAADFGASKMEVGGSYYVYIGITATGYSGVYLEVGLRDNLITITQDGIRS